MRRPLLYLWSCVCEAVKLSKSWRLRHLQPWRSKFERKKSSLAESSKKVFQKYSPKVECIIDWRLVCFFLPPTGVFKICFIQPIYVCESQLRCVGEIAWDRWGILRQFERLTPVSTCSRWRVYVDVTSFQWNVNDDSSCKNDDEDDDNNNSNKTKWNNNKLYYDNGLKSSCWCNCDDVLFVSTN